MITCDLLAERLESDGATIIWAKHSYEPTTDLRPDSLHREAIEALALHPDTTKKISGEDRIQHMIDNEAALLFYRVAEIRARGAIVNRQHPDLTICVHYNADSWGDPNNPILVDHSRLVIFINGAYEDSEIAYDDEKYDLLRKLLDRDAPQEERGCALVGQEMLDILKYPPDLSRTRHLLRRPLHERPRRLLPHHRRRLPRHPRHPGPARRKHLPPVRRGGRKRRVKVLRQIIPAILSAA
jgi:hypothetical protein